MSTTYKITIWNPKTRETSTLAEMPERRSDPQRRGRWTVLNWIKLTYGEEWYRKNKNLIGIAEHNGRKE